jgi:hypothetical protein
MAWLHPYDTVYEDYQRLHRRLKHDGVLVEDPQVGDYIYLSDGPRLILEINEHGSFGVPDTGGPITGGWTRGRYTAYRGGTDHIMAKADYQESELRRKRRRTGRKH